MLSLVQKLADITLQSDTPLYVPTCQGVHKAPNIAHQTQTHQRLICYHLWRYQPAVFPAQKNNSFMLTECLLYQLNNQTMQLEFKTLKMTKSIFSVIVHISLFILGSSLFLICCCFIILWTYLYKWKSDIIIKWIS